MQHCSGQAVNSGSLKIAILAQPATLTVSKWLYQQLSGKLVEPVVVQPQTTIVHYRDQSACTRAFTIDI